MKICITKAVWNIKQNKVPLLGASLNLMFCEMKQHYYGINKRIRLPHAGAEMHHLEFCKRTFCNCENGGLRMWCDCLPRNRHSESHVLGRRMKIFAQKTMALQIAFEKFHEHTPLANLDDCSSDECVDRRDSSRFFNAKSRPAGGCWFSIEQE